MNCNSNNKLKYLESSVNRLENDKAIILNELQDKNSKMMNIDRELFSNNQSNRELEHRLESIQI